MGCLGAWWCRHERAEVSQPVVAGDVSVLKDEQLVSMCSLCNYAEVQDFVIAQFH